MGKTFRNWSIFLLSIILVLSLIGALDIEEKETFVKKKLYSGVLLHTLESVDNVNNCICNSCAYAEPNGLNWIHLKSECNKGQCICLEKTKKLVWD